MADDNKQGVEQVRSMVSAMQATLDRVSKLEKALIASENDIKTLRENIGEKQFIHCFRHDNAGGRHTYVPVTTILDEMRKRIEGVL